MWIRAHENIQRITGMRIQTATSSVLETYGPIRGSSLGGRETKFPVGEGRYEIRSRFYCRFSGPDCEDLKARATNLFNMTVPDPKN